MALCWNACALGQRRLRQVLRVASHHRREAHYLGDADNALMGEQPLHLREPEAGACGLQRRARHARRHGHPHVERQVVRHVEEPAHASLTRDVGELVRVADDAGNAPRHHHLGERGRGDERRLDVHVAVYQPRKHEAAMRVEGLPGAREVVSHRGDEPARDEHVGGPHFAREYVDDLPSLEEQVARLSPGRHRDRGGHLICCG